MKILIDIGHPGHVHYFKNLISSLTDKGHQFKVTARKRNVIFILLQKYNIPFINRGEGKNSRIGKLLYMLRADLHLLLISLKFKPDLFLSFSSPYAAQVAWLLGKHHIAINDTEHTDKTHSKFTYPFSKCILTPFNYQNDLGVKHIRFNNVVEGLYLGEKYFSPDSSIRQYLGLNDGEEFVLLRFVSWQAHHDYGQSGIDLNTKRELVSTLSKKYKVFISSEGSVVDEFKDYEIKIPAEKMHDVLYYASMFIAESGTMASEAAFLGTPTVYVNTLPLMCYLKLEQEHGLLTHFKSSIGVVEFVKSLMNQENLATSYYNKSVEMKNQFVDVTAFLNWFIENYPNSVNVIRENPDYQYIFK